MFLSIPASWFCSDISTNYARDAHSFEQVTNGSYMAVQTRYEQLKHKKDRPTSSTSELFHIIMLLFFSTDIFKGQP